VISAAVVVVVCVVGAFDRLCAGDWSGEEVRSIGAVGVRGRFSDADMVVEFHGFCQML